MYKGGAKDDLTEPNLPDDLVKVGMTKELVYFNSKGVCEIVPIAECRRLTAIPDQRQVGLHQQRGSREA